MKVKGFTNELLLDIANAAIRYSHRIGPDDDEMGITNHAFQDDEDDASTYVNGTASYLIKRDGYWLLKMLQDEYLNASTPRTDLITATKFQNPSSVTFPSKLQHLT